MNTGTKVFRDKRMATGTELRSAVGVDRHELSSSLCRFLRKHRDELTPTRISDGLGQTVVAQHPLGVEGLHRNNPEPVYDPPSFLMDEIMSAVGDTFVDTGNNLSGFTSFRCAFLQFGKFPLRFSKGFLISPEKPWIVYPLTCRESSEVSQSHVNSHRRIGWWQWLAFILCGKAGIPLIIMSSDGTDADFPEGLTMQPYLDITNFCQSQTAVYMEPELSVGEAVVPVISLKSGIARRLPSLHSPEKSAKGFVQSVSHILEHLRVDIIEAGALRFKLPDTLALLEIGKGFLFFLPGILALLKEFIIEPPTLIKLRLKNLSLMLRGIEPVFKRLIHYLNYILKERKCQAN